MTHHPRKRRLTPLQSDLALWLLDSDLSERLLTVVNVVSHDRPLCEGTTDIVGDLRDALVALFREGLVHLFSEDRSTYPATRMYLEEEAAMRVLLSFEEHLAWDAEGLYDWADAALPADRHVGLTQRGVALLEE